MGKNYVESSLKRFLKRKVKITLGFVVAFMIMGTGAFAATELTDEKITITSPYDDEEYKIFGEEVTIENENEDKEQGIVFKGNGDKAIIVKGNGTEENPGTQTLNLIANGGEVINNTQISGIDTVILTNNSGDGIAGSYKNNIIEANTVKITTTGSGIHTGINTITADTVEITSNSKGITGYGVQTITAKKVDIYSDDTGIHVEDPQGNIADQCKVDIQGFETLNIISKAGYGVRHATTTTQGIYLKGTDDSVINITSADSEKRSAVRTQADNEIKISGGKITLNGVGCDENSGYGGVINATAGTIDIEAKESITVNCVEEFDADLKPIKTKIDGTAILGFGTGNINLNAQNQDGIVANIIINGNIDLDGSSALKANLNGDNSVLNGKIDTEDGASSNIQFSNGATWNNTGDSTVSNLDLSDAIIDMSYAKNGQDITIQNMKGTGGTFVMDISEEDTDHTNKKTDFIKIENSGTNTRISQTHYIQLKSVDNLVKYDFNKAIWFADTDKNITFTGKEYSTLANVFDYNPIIETNIKDTDTSDRTNWYITGLEKKENEGPQAVMDDISLLFQDLNLILFIKEWER